MGLYPLGVACALRAVATAVRFPVFFSLGKSTTYRGPSWFFAESEWTPALWSDTAILTGGFRWGRDCAPDEKWAQLSELWQVAVPLLSEVKGKATAPWIFGLKLLQLVESSSGLIEQFIITVIGINVSIFGWIILFLNLNPAGPDGKRDRKYYKNIHQDNHCRYCNRFHSSQ